jgi:hypothetical protein
VHEVNILILSTGGKADDKVEVTQPNIWGYEFNVYGGSDDIPLPITVWTEYGIPVRVVTWAAQISAIFFAALGSIGGLTTIFGWFRRRRRRQQIANPSVHNS